MKSIQMQFVTSLGKSHTVTLNYASPALLEEGGRDTVQAAVDTLIAQQPFNVTLASCKSADVIERTVTPIDID